VYLLPAVGLLAATVYATAEHGFTWQLPVFALGPDVALLVGVGRGLARGQLHPRAVPLYNALHRLIGPVALLLAAAVFDLSPGWLIAGLAWATHVLVDRTLGYGLRTREGFQRA
jgi:hypothetical protein